MVGAGMQDWIAPAPRAGHHKSAGTILGSDVRRCRVPCGRLSVWHAGRHAVKGYSLPSAIQR